MRKRSDRNKRTTDEANILSTPRKQKMSYDRFIPVAGINTAAKFQFLSSIEKTPESKGRKYDEQEMKKYHQVMINELMPSASLMQSPILNFSNNVFTPSQRESPLQKYSGSRLSLASQRILQTPKTTVRYISKTPFKVLDAPDLQDDFYLNLLDWSTSNLMAVGLGSCAYLYFYLTRWSAQTSAVTKLCDLGGDSVTSVCWMQRVLCFDVGKPSCYRNHTRTRAAMGCA